MGPAITFPAALVYGRLTCPTMHLLATTYGAAYGTVMTALTFIALD